MKPLSLKLRITLLTVAIIALVIIIVSVVTYQDLKESLARASDPALHDAAADLQPAIANLPPKPNQADLQAILKRSTAAESIELLAWLEGDSNVASIHSPRPTDAHVWLAALEKTRLPEPGKDRTLTMLNAGKAYRGHWERYPLPGGALYVLAVTPIPFAQHEMEEFYLMLLTLGGGTLLAVGVLAALSVPWAMRPIRATAKRLAGITHSNLGSEHLDGISAPAELVPFVDSVRAMLARVNEGVQSQKRFIAEASHELRTPLAIAKSTIQAAQLSARTSDEYRRTLDELLVDVDRLNQLVTQLLDLARLEETPHQTAQPVAIAPLLDMLADRHARQVSPAGGRIVCDLPDASLTVKGNPTELASLLGNLIDNAAKHGPRGGVITLRAKAGPDACLITVHDQGGHIPPDQIGRLFDRFYRADASRSRATGGSGLGLTIARQIALRHGGDIQIQSTPAEGTTVQIRLPMDN